MPQNLADRVKFRTCRNLVIELLFTYAYGLLDFDYNLTLCFPSLLRIACFRPADRIVPKNGMKIHSLLSCRNIAKSLHSK